MYVYTYILFNIDSYVAVRGFGIGFVYVLCILDLWYRIV